jgi:hypothetical protein
MSDGQKHEQQFPVRLTLAQRKVVAEVVAPLARRLKLDEPNERAVSLALDEMRVIQQKARLAIGGFDSGMKRNSLRHVICVTEQAIEHFQGIGRIPHKERIYQFKIRLKGSTPPIWRRIQVKDCSLDQLHEAIQTAMGWTNSHLHHFRIDGKLYGDPWLMEEDFGEMGYADSRVTRLSQIVPKSGRPFHFEYEYDFGDSWRHDVLFEGCLRGEAGRRYPLCVEGERACPPEDVGGTSGYRGFVKALTNPGHRRRDELLTWSDGWFDPEEFDAEQATKRMRCGLPDWRSME